MNLKPKEGNFDLNKVKTLKDGGLDVHFEVTEVIGEETYTEKLHIESAKETHPDLKKLFKAIRPIMGRVFHLTSYLSMVEADEFKPTKKQNEAARTFQDELLNNIEIRGISLSGKDDNVGVVITAVLTVLNGQKVAINSPRITFKNVTYGFEEELESIVNDIEKETYKFLFEGKKAQLELGFGEGAEDDEEEGEASAEDGEDLPE